jgi:hypothetical protein
MTHRGLVRFYQHEVDRQLGEGVVQVQFIADEDVRPHDTYVQGFFDLYWFENCYDAPILLQIIAYCNADIDDSELDGLDTEASITVNHELIHLKQEQEGRFIEDWDGEYQDNPNEIEAYADEGKGTFKIER